MTDFTFEPRITDDSLRRNPAPPVVPPPEPERTNIGMYIVVVAVVCIIIFLILVLYTAKDKNDKKILEEIKLAQSQQPPPQQAPPQQAPVTPSQSPPQQAPMTPSQQQPIAPQQDHLMPVMLMSNGVQYFHEDFLRKKLNDQHDALVSRFKELELAAHNTTKKPENTTTTSANIVNTSKGDDGEPLAM